VNVAEKFLRAIFPWTHAAIVGLTTRKPPPCETERSVVRESHTGFEAESFAAAALAEAYAYSGEPDRAVRMVRRRGDGKRVKAVSGCCRSQSSPSRGFFCARSASRPAVRSKRSSRNSGDSPER
jgi:hypothetical protein